MKDFKFYTERELKKLKVENLQQYYISLYTEITIIHRLFPDIKKEMKKELYKAFNNTYKIKLRQPVFYKCCNKMYGGYYNYIQHCRTKAHIKRATKESITEHNTVIPNIVPTIEHIIEPKKVPNTEPITEHNNVVPNTEPITEHNNVVPNTEPITEHNNVVPNTELITHNNVVPNTEPITEHNNVVPNTETIIEPPKKQ